MKRNEIIISLSALILCFVGLYFVIEYMGQPDKVIETIDVGTIIDISYNQGPPSEWPTSHIKTTKGSFIAYGRMSFFYNDKAVIKVIKNRSKVFCSETIKACERLM